MDRIDHLTGRLDRMEARVAHQDKTIEDLNEVVTGQWREIAKLRRLVERLEGELAEAEQARRDPQRVEPPPPHY
jgi:SlyX protein